MKNLINVFIIENGERCPQKHIVVHCILSIKEFVSHNVVMCLVTVFNDHGQRTHSFSLDITGHRLADYHYYTFSDKLNFCLAKICCLNYTSVWSRICFFHIFFKYDKNSIIILYVEWYRCHTSLQLIPPVYSLIL